jgi:hypothetical protein
VVSERVLHWPVEPSGVRSRDFRRPVGRFRRFLAEPTRSPDRVLSLGLAHYNTPLLRLWFRAPFVAPLVSPVLIGLVKLGVLGAGSPSGAFVT